MKDRIQYEQGEAFIARRIAGEAVLVPVGSGSLNGMVTFNETGNFLWQKLLEGSTAEELTDALCETFDVSESDARKDIARFLELCLREGMLRPRSNEMQEHI